MSSLAASRADNYYVPPEFDGEKHRSVNAYNKSQAPGAHAKHRKKDGGLTVRFEMPFNAWCGGCGAVLAKGIRFNARKRRTGSYHSTPVYTFTMLTSCCCSELEIVADPQLCDYVIAKGARKHARAAAADAEAAARAEARDDDPMMALERRQTQARDGKLPAAAAPGPSPRRGGAAANPILEMERSRDHEAEARREDKRLEGIRRLNRETQQDDYTANKALRRAMRSQRNRHEADALRARELCLPEAMRLRPSTAEDRRAAAAAMERRDAGGRPPSAAASLRSARRKLGAESIFKGPGREGGGRAAPSHPVAALSERLKRAGGRAAARASSPPPRPPAGVRVKKRRR